MWCGGVCAGWENAAEINESAIMKMRNGEIRPNLHFAAMRYVQAIPPICMTRPIEAEVANKFYGVIENLGWMLEATDPRDKIYALLPLFAEPFVMALGDLPFQPNYSLPVAEVYCQVTKYFIQATGSLVILKACSSGRAQDCPTWVSDFSTQALSIHTDVFWKWGRTLEPKSYRDHLSPELGEADWPGDETDAFAFDDNKPMQLTVWGCVLGVVLRSTPSSPHQGRTQPFLREGFSLSDSQIEWATEAAKLVFETPEVRDAYKGGEINLDSVLDMLLLGGGSVERQKPSPTAPWLKMVQGQNVDWDEEADTLALRFDGLPSSVVFCTKNGLVGLGDPQISKGDVLTWIHGLGVGMVLRGAGSCWRVVGPSGVVVDKIETLVDFLYPEPMVLI
jgi:hypothetical protein